MCWLVRTKWYFCVTIYQNCHGRTFGCMGFVQECMGFVQEILGHYVLLNGCPPEKTWRRIGNATVDCKLVLSSNVHGVFFLVWGGVRRRRERVKKKAQRPRAGGVFAGVRGGLTGPWSVLVFAHPPPSGKFDVKMKKLKKKKREIVGWRCAGVC